jgi:hypothetical protein
MKKVILSVFLMALLFLLKCSGRDTLYNENINATRLEISAHISITMPSEPFDTTTYTLIDTVHTGDTVYFVGITSHGDENLISLWDFGDGTTSDKDFIVSHSYEKGGYYKPILTVTDKAGFSLADTVHIYVNTIPNIPLQILPEDGFSNVNTEIPFLFRWSARDNDGDQLLHKLFLDTLNPPLEFIASTADTEYSIDANTLKPLKVYYWSIVATDKYGDSSLISIRHFATRDIAVITTGTVNGYVRRENYHDASGIKVEALRSGVVIASTYADSSGYFVVEGIPAGQLKLAFSNSDLYKPETLFTEIIAGETTGIEIQTLKDVYPPEITKSPDTLIRYGTNAALRVVARDTFSYVTVLEIELGSGYVSLPDGDTLLPLNSYGLHYFPIKAIDNNGNIAYDTIKVRVNEPPTIPQLLGPIGGWSIEAKSNPVFSWRSGDPDKTATVSFKLFVGTSTTLVESDVKVINYTDSVYSAWASPDVNLLHYWKISATDGMDTVSSSIDSFNVGYFAVTMGAVAGSIVRHGGYSGEGISVTAYKNSAIVATTTTDSAGSFMLRNVLYGPLILIYTHNGYAKPETTYTSVVAGDTVNLPVDTLYDVRPPQIYTSPDTTIRRGTFVNLRLTARDTFSVVSLLQMDLGSGFVNLPDGDTSLLMSTYGLFMFPIIVVDNFGNTGRDTINIRVNEPPTVPVLLTPANGARIEVNSNPVFSWSAQDPDSTGVVKFAIYVGQSRLLQQSDIKAINRTDSVYGLWNSSNVSRPYFWKVTATDGLDIVESSIDSISVGRYTVSRIYGRALLQGVRRHNGIKVTLSGPQTYYVPTDDSGRVWIEVEPGTYTVTATDTLRNAFNVGIGSLSVLAGDSGTFGSIILEDTKKPHIMCVSPVNGYVYSSLSTRSLTIQGIFIDTGSQVHLDSVKVVQNGAIINNVIKTSTNWQFTVNGIADGRYTFTVSAADSAGNQAVPLTRNYYVNSKQIDTRIAFHHDTMYCTTSVSNVSPGIRAYYWNFDKRATPAWNDSTITTTVSNVTYAWPLTHPIVAGRDTFIVMAVDDSGMAVYDTVAYMVTDDKPIAKAGNDTVVSIGSSTVPVLLRPNYVQGFGHATRFDWSINGGSFLRTDISDTTIFVQSSYHPGITCILRVTDDKGNMTYDTMYVTVGKQWEIVGSASLGTANSENFGLGVFSDDEIYVGYSDPTNLNKLTVKRWNGSSWITSGSGISSGNASYVQIAVGTGYWSGGGSSGQYSIPTVAFADGTGYRVRVLKPNGDTVGSQSRVDGQFGAFRLAQTSRYVDETMYLAFGDNTATDKIRVSRFLSGMYNWDSVGTLAGASVNRAVDFTTDGSTHYLLLHKDVFSDTLKRFNGSTWQTVTALTNVNAPTIHYDSSLYMADRDKSSSNQLTVKYWSGASWTQIGAALTSSPSGVNNYYPSGSLGSVGIQKAGSYIVSAYQEFDESGTRDSLKVKAFDGTKWNRVGVSGLPLQRVAFNKAAFCCKNGKMYIAYANASGGQLYVLRLR